MYVSGFVLQLPLLCNQRGAFWVQMCPAARTQLTTSLIHHQIPTFWRFRSRPTVNQLMLRIGHTHGFNIPAYSFRGETIPNKKVSSYYQIFDFMKCTNYLYSLPDKIIQ